jgi:glutathione peroxidase
MWYKKTSAENKEPVAEHKAEPVVSFYGLFALLNNGDEFSFQILKGKKVLIVNTASNCAYTSQFAALQQLYEEYKGKLLILAFPSNDFKEQENGTDEEIGRFCQINFGVSFPLAKKSVVVKSEDQNEVFKWLTQKELNGWNEQSPSWNFSKYLINEKGILTHFFNPAVSPSSQEVLKAINS